MQKGYCFYCFGVLPSKGLLPVGVALRNQQAYAGVTDESFYLLRKQACAALLRMQRGCCFVVFTYWLLLWSNSYKVAISDRNLLALANRQELQSKNQ